MREKRKKKKEKEMTRQQRGREKRDGGVGMRKSIDGKRERERYTEKRRGGGDSDRWCYRDCCRAVEKERKKEKSGDREATDESRGMREEEKKRRNARAKKRSKSEELAIEKSGGRGYNVIERSRS